MLYVTHEMLGMEEGGGGAWREKATKGNKGEEREGRGFPGIIRGGDKTRKKGGSNVLIHNH